MIDRGKVIKGLECCVKESEWYKEPCRECSYGATYGAKGGGCIDRLLADTITLLKEQETANLYKCPNCGTWVSAENVVRCKDCEHHKKGTCSAAAGMAFPPPDDWFCADGERKEDGEVK